MCQVICISLLFAAQYKYLMIVITMDAVYSEQVNFAQFPKRFISIGQIKGQRGTQI